MCIRDRLYSRVFIINVSNPAAPTLTGVYSAGGWAADVAVSVSYTHLRAHETVLDLVCRLLLEKKK